jgi:ketosteroid isomerase-like protein
MKRLTAAVCTALTIALACAAPVRADERGKEVEAFMASYLKLWNAHDAKAITEQIYRFDGPNPMGTKAGLQAEFDRLKAQGYDHSENISIKACLVTPAQALVEFRFSRLKADGSALPPRERASLYMARKFPDGWRINQLIGMDPTAHLTCTSYTD